ncbi:hypothetical protein CAEBREN_07666 [Caenorhabditis brenneri]|uniref:CWH43-like N-terminal domain-containing protein n=1 Tax=Caenorhabditis brenneri TaxID=135651 RepID=G0MAX2_CAEBE|nr:hypothetical protein CAEBREN_07666 [Caenorhabditis brenneri]
MMMLTQTNLLSVAIYALAVIRGDVDPIFPYISSAADKRPESCIFAMGTNISSFLVLFMIYVRYNQMVGIINAHHDFQLAKWNYMAKCFGYLAATGMFVVANVQETAITQVHMTAAICTFGGFTIWMTFQCYLTKYYNENITHYSVYVYRVIFTILSAIFFFTSIGFGTAAAYVFHLTYPDLPTPRPWNRRIYQPGYHLHQVSAFAEWGCAISQVLFMQSFIPEFEDVFIEYRFAGRYAYLPEPPRPPTQEEIDAEDHRLAEEFRMSIGRFM